MQEYFINELLRRISHSPGVSTDILLQQLQNIHTHTLSTSQTHASENHRLPNVNTRSFAIGCKPTHACGSICGLATPY